MNTFKRTMALLLAATCVAPLLACDKKGDSSSSFSANSIDQAERDAITEILKSIESKDVFTYDTLENKTIKWMANWDINPDASGKAEPIELTLFQQKYNGVIEYYPVDWENRFDELATAIVGGEGIDFFPAGDMDVLPKGAIKGTFAAIDDYVDFDKELWSNVREANDSLMWNGKHYIVCTSLTGANCTVIYNKKTIADAGLPDPAQLFKEGKWTWDAFYNMAETFVNGSEGHYGVDGYWTEAGLSLTTGVPYIGLEDGKLVNNLKDPSLERVHAVMYNLYNNNLTLKRADFAWEAQPQFIGEGKTLFYPCGLWTLYEAKSKWSANYGEDVFFVPMPKDPESDEYYIPTGLDGYVLCSNGQNPEGVIAFSECKRLAIESEDAEQIGRDKLKNEYGWTDEMIDMQDQLAEMAQENPVFDFYKCVNADLTTILDSETDGIRCSLSQGTLWNEIMNGCYDTVQTIIDDTNENPIQGGN